MSETEFEVLRVQFLVSLWGAEETRDCHSLISLPMLSLALSWLSCRSKGSLVTELWGAAAA